MIVLNHDRMQGYGRTNQYLYTIFICVISLRRIFMKQRKMLPKKKKLLLRENKTPKGYGKNF